MSVPGSNSGPFGFPRGGPFYVFPVTGTIQRQDNPVAAQAMASAGWIGFPTMAAAENYAHNLSPAHQVDNTVKTTTGFIAELTNPHLWLRVAEVVIGLVLIAVGVARMTGVSNAVARAAETAGKAAVVA